MPTRKQELRNSTVWALADNHFKFVLIENYYIGITLLYVHKR